MPSGSTLIGLGSGIQDAGKMIADAFQEMYRRKEQGRQNAFEAQRLALESRRVNESEQRGDESQARWLVDAAKPGSVWDPAQVALLRRANMMNSAAPEQKQTTLESLPGPQEAGFGSSALPAPGIENPPLPEDVKPTGRYLAVPSENSRRAIAQLNVESRRLNLQRNNEWRLMLQQRREELARELSGETNDLRRQSLDQERQKIDIALRRISMDELNTDFDNSLGYDRAVNGGGSSGPSPFIQAILPFLMKSDPAAAASLAMPQGGTKAFTPRMAPPTTHQAGPQPPQRQGQPQGQILPQGPPGPQLDLSGVSSPGPQPERPAPNFSIGPPNPVMQNGASLPPVSGNRQARAAEHLRSMGYDSSPASVSNFLHNNPQFP